MFNPTSDSPLSSVLAQLGFDSSSEIDTLDRDTSSIDGKGLDLLKNIAGQDKKPTDTSNNSSEKVDTSKDLSVIPDYMKSHEDMLNRKFDFEPEDTTNYTSKAISELGPNFSHIHSKDGFYDQVMMKEAKQEYLDNNPTYAELIEYTENYLSDDDLVRKALEEEMRAKRTFTEQGFQDQLDQLFTEGVLNQSGRRMLSGIQKGLKELRAKIEDQAQQHAFQSLSKFKDYKRIFEDESQKFNPLGFEIPDDLRRHLKEFVLAGKHNTIDEKMTTNERAQRELLQALVLSPKALIEFVDIISKKGIQFGADQIKKKVF